MNQIPEGGPPSEGRTFEGLSIAAIMPCHNEEVAVAAVVRDLKAAVEGFTVYVYDNHGPHNRDCRRIPALSPAYLPERATVQAKQHLDHR